MDDDDGDLACLSHRHIRRASSSLPLLFLFAVAVLCTMEDSSKVFAIGNIEQVAVADSTVDARRATGSSSAEYLRQLSMSQRSNGVFINDPKGLFILRWYREVKGDGTPPRQTARATRTERASTTS